MLFRTVDLSLERHTWNLEGGRVALWVLVIEAIFSLLSFVFIFAECCIKGPASLAQVPQDINIPNCLSPFSLPQDPEGVMTWVDSIWILPHSFVAAPAAAGGPTPDGSGLGPLGRATAQEGLALTRTLSSPFGLYNAILCLASDLTQNNALPVWLYR